MNKSRLWQDIDKHPLNDEAGFIDVKMECGSILLSCSWSPSSRICMFRGAKLHETAITQWRYSK